MNEEEEAFIRSDGYEPFPADWLRGEVLGRAAVARIFNVDPATISRWALQGRIGYYRTPSGNRVFPQCEVERLMRGEPAPDFIRRNLERDRMKYHFVRRPVRGKSRYTTEDEGGTEQDGD